MQPESALMSDEAILGIDDSPGSDVSSESEAPEISSQSEVEEATQETQFSPEQSKPGTQPQATDKAQPAKVQQPGKENTPEQAQGVIAAKAAELDRSDAAFANGDISGIVETLESLFGENPAGLTDAMWAGYRFMEQRSPEQYAHFSKMIVSDQLAQIGVKWETFVKLAGYLERAGDRETFDDLNKLAVFLKQVGHGPSSPETQSASVQGYTRQIGGMLERSVPALIRSTFGERFSSVNPVDQKELLTAANLAVRDFLKKDQKLGAALEKLGKQYSEKEGVRIYLEILAPKLRSIIPLVANKLASEYSDLFKNIPVKPQAPRPARPAKPAETKPSNWAEVRAKGMSLADVLKATEGEIASGSFLTQEEADGMSDMDVLSSRRVPLARKTWQPGNELDGL